MDKIIYLVLGAAALILAAVDQTGSQQSPQQPSAVVAQSLPRKQDQGWHTSAIAQPDVPAVPIGYVEPVNPIPHASDLNGKVLDDRFQSDG